MAPDEASIRKASWRIEGSDLLAVAVWISGLYVLGKNLLSALVIKGLGFSNTVAFFLDVEKVSYGNVDTLLYECLVLVFVLALILSCVAHMIRHKVIVRLDRIWQKLDEHGVFALCLAAVLLVGAVLTFMVSLKIVFFYLVVILFLLAVYANASVVVRFLLVYAGTFLMCLFLAIYVTEQHVDYQARVRHSGDAEVVAGGESITGHILVVTQDSVVMQADSGEVVVLARRQISRIEFEDGLRH